MKPTNIKHYIALSFCFMSLFFVTTNLNAQKGQTKGGNKTQAVSSSAEGNKQVLNDIELLREEIAARKALQDQQREMLQNLHDKLENKIDGEGKQTVSIVNDFYDNTAVDNLDMKFDLEMQMAEREIGMLRDQLELAYIELDQCKRERDASIALPTIKATEIYQPIPAAKVTKAKKVKAATPATNVVVEEVIIQQVSEENQQVMGEIEMLKEKIRQRKEQQDKQRRELEILQGEIESQF